MSTVVPESRLIYDCDSHVLETNDWLSTHASASDRDLVDQLVDSNEFPAIHAEMQAAAERNSSATASDPLQEATPINGPKGWLGYGASDPVERSAALTLLGFAKQLVIPSFSIAPLIVRAESPAKVQASARALNCHMADFCRSDGRLFATGFLPLGDPDESLAVAREGISEGIAAFWLNSDPVSDLSPSHKQFDPIWQLLADSGVPVILHLGGGGAPTAEYRNSGHFDVRELLPDFALNREIDNLAKGATTARDVHALAHGAQNFISAFIFDQVFQRYPNLRCGVIELGASWVPGYLRSIDHAANMFHSEQMVMTMEARPSEVFRRHVSVSVLPGEDVGWLIRDAGEDVFMFGSDYPHPEGGSDPVGQADAFLDAAGTAQEERDAFFFKNFADLMALTN